MYSCLFIKVFYYQNFYPNLPKASPGHLNVMVLRAAGDRVRNNVYVCVCVFLVFFFGGAPQYEMFQYNKDCLLWCSWSPSSVPGNANYSVNRGFLSCRQIFLPYLSNRRWITSSNGILIAGSQTTSRRILRKAL
jgi:hypothetical protein